ncbi:MAG: hypothetical protein IT454_14740 [Planctomycetes bacterium]|nr:hypothetical protein [Planctomycetota bacterium]
MPDTLRLGAAIALTLLGACTLPGPLAPQEWVSVSGNVFEPESPGARDYQDAAGWSLGGGLDLNADRVAVAWEVEAAWSQHDVIDGFEELNNDYDIVRVSTGLRLHSRLEALPLGVYARGGLEWRDESSDSGLIVGRDELGSYFGVGLEWWYTPFAALGPLVGWSFDGDGQLSETRIGLAVRFY